MTKKGELFASFRESATTLIMPDFYKLARPVLSRLSPETAHRLTLAALRLMPPPPAALPADPALRVTLWNRSFPNPVGLAAGFDKNAEAVGPLLRFGFGFVEAGTVTPKPQRGNPRPRVFRSAADQAVINRMGFPNGGLNAFKDNFERFLRARPRPPGIVGINIGMNKSQAEPAKDYCLLLEQLGPFADYIAVNISSPNTPGLRDLQKRDAFLSLIGEIFAERRRSCGINPPPILVKLSPDLAENDLGILAAAMLDSGVEGVILTNTTLDRPDDIDREFANETGGLSGLPLRGRSTEVIRNFYALTRGKIPIIGVGGIAGPADAYEKIRAGASLVQLYTGLVFHGPDVVKNIHTGLLECLRRDGFTHISQAVGMDPHKNKKK
jgi:dihydroorotate dehydrogenase